MRYVSASRGMGLFQHNENDPISIIDCDQLNIIEDYV